MSRPTLIRRIDVAAAQAANARALLRREWLVTNGLGGYASGTISGSVSRRYHGLLVAALPAPFGRMVMLNHLAEYLRLPDGRVLQFGGEEPAGTEGIEDESLVHYVREFRLEDGLPIWRFNVEGVVVEKRMMLVHMQNTAHISYRLIAGADRIRLQVRPSLHFRGHENDVSASLQNDYALTIHGRRYEVAPPESLYPLRFFMDDDQATFTHDGGRLREITYQVEADRGYHSRGLLWSPGYFGADLRPNLPFTLIASTESWSSILALEPQTALTAETERRHRLLALAPPQAQAGPAAELVLAADQFIITPAGRVEDAARARAAGGDVRTVIAGYHWFTDWGRDTMISLEGLTLITGRHVEAGWILRTFAHYVRDGLIPNLFPEGESEGLYHTADASLWFFHALDRYLETTGDRTTLELILPRLTGIADHHLRGTHFGIGVDPVDGLLRQGAPGYQLTWMDAKVDGWVVTPRRGKAVEINALWYNALRLLGGWLTAVRGEGAAREVEQRAKCVFESFNK